MSADEIRKLAESSALESACGFAIDNDCCGNACDDDEIRECQQKKDIRSALLDYAAMVERCENVRTNLESNRKNYANRKECGSLMETNNDEIEMLDYILRGDAGKEER